MLWQELQKFCIVVLIRKSGLFSEVRIGVLRPGQDDLISYGIVVRGTLAVMQANIDGPLPKTQ